MTTAESNTGHLDSQISVIAGDSQVMYWARILVEDTLKPAAAEALRADLGGLISRQYGLPSAVSNSIVTAAERKQYIRELNRG